MIDVHMLGGWAYEEDWFERRRYRPDGTVIERQATHQQPNPAQRLKLVKRGVLKRDGTPARSWKSGAFSGLTGELEALAAALEARGHQVFMHDVEGVVPNWFRGRSTSNCVALVRGEELVYLFSAREAEDLVPLRWTPEAIAEAVDAYDDAVAAAEAERLRAQELEDTARSMAERLEAGEDLTPAELRTMLALVLRGRASSA